MRIAFYVSLCERPPRLAVPDHAAYPPRPELPTRHPPPRRPTRHPRHPCPYPAPAYTGPPTLHPRRPTLHRLKKKNRKGDDQVPPPDRLPCTPGATPPKSPPRPPTLHRPADTKRPGPPTPNSLPCTRPNTNEREATKVPPPTAYPAPPRLPTLHPKAGPRKPRAGPRTSPGDQVRRRPNPPTRHPRTSNAPKPVLPPAAPSPPPQPAYPAPPRQQETTKSSQVLPPTHTHTHLSLSLSLSQDPVRPASHSGWRALAGKSRRRRAYPQQIVTTRLLYCLQDPFAQLSRLQRI